MALEAFEVASLEELHEKLGPFLGGTAGADGAVTVDGEGVALAGESRGGVPLVGTEASASSPALRPRADARLRELGTAGTTPTGLG